MSPRPRADDAPEVEETGAQPPVYAPGEHRRTDGTVLEVFGDGSASIHLPGGGDLVVRPAVDEPLGPLVDALQYVDVPGPDRWAETPSSSVDLGPADVPVHVAFASVMAEVGAIPKRHEHNSPGSRFMFRGIEDVQAALYPILVRHGSFVLPDAVLERRELTGRTTNDGKPYAAVALHVRFRFTGPRGDSLTFEGWGEGQDRSDKATGKAHSMAAKSALLQAFMIPTADQDDADRTEAEERPLTPEQEQARAAALQRAADAVAKATTVGQLDAIGGEAARQGLLRLEVVLPESGERLTLQQYGERRIAELKGAPPAGEPAGDTGEGGSAGEQS